MENRENKGKKFIVKGNHYQVLAAHIIGLITELLLLPIHSLLTATENI
jgi:hypothetical protein